MKVTDIITKELKDHITNELPDRFHVMPTTQIVASLVEDMEMLRTGNWEPDDDSIDAHVDLIAELFRRVLKSEGVDNE
jgi:hypothetical protein